MEPLGLIVGRHSTLLRARVRMEPRSTVVYIKMYGLENDRSESQRYAVYVKTEGDRLRVRAFENDPVLRLPRLIADLPDRMTVVTEELEGCTLADLLRRLAVYRVPHVAATTGRALTNVGQWLRRWQSEVALIGRGEYDMRWYLEVRLSALRALRRPAFGPGEYDAILRLFDGYASALTDDDRRLVPMHGDLCPANIIVNDPAVAVIDFSTSCDGPKYADVAHLLMHLELAGDRLCLGRARTTALGRALLRGYDARFDCETPLFRLMLLQHLICHLKTAATERYARTALGDWQFRRAVARVFRIQQSHRW